MYELRMVEGRVRELGNSSVGPSSSEYSNVIIDTSDGGVAQVRRAFAGVEMTNAIRVGTDGTFWFIKNIANGRSLVAFKGDGEFRAVGSIGYLPIAMFLLFFSVPLGMFMPPFYMLALVGMFILVSGFRTTRQLNALKAKYAADPTIRNPRPRLV